MVAGDIARYYAAGTHIANGPSPPVSSLFQKPRWIRMYYSNHGEWPRCPQGNHMHHIGSSDQRKDSCSGSTTHTTQKWELGNLASNN